MLKFIGSASRHRRAVALLAIAFARALPASAITFSLGSASPIPGPYDLYNFAGADMDMHNVYAAGNAPAGGATFYRLQYASGMQLIPVVSWQTNTDGLTVQMNPGTLKLQVFSPRAIRVAYSLSNSVPTNSLAVIASPASSGWSAGVSANEISLTTAALQVRVIRATGAVGFYDTNGAALLTEPLTGGKSLTAASVAGVSKLQSRQQFVISPTEAFYGLGQHWPD